MITLDNAVSTMKARLKESGRFDNVSVITAYPKSFKQTRLERAVVALGIERLDVEQNELESNTKAGELSIFADIYVPTSAGGDEAICILSDVCTVLDAYLITAVKADKPTYNSAVQATQIKAVISFSDRITFGGGSIE